MTRNQKLTTRAIWISCLLSCASCVQSDRELSDAVNAYGGSAYGSSVNLAWRNVNDEALAQLTPKMKRIKHLFLNLQHTKVTDRGLQALQDLCGTLSSLDLSGTAVTDGGMESLRDCRDLDDLAINDTKVGDLGLKVIAQLHLRKLRLSDLVTDRGLERLQEMNSLRQLELPEAGPVADKAIKDLEERLPRLKVFRAFKEVCVAAKEPTVLIEPYEARAALIEMTDMQPHMPPLERELKILRETLLVSLDDEKFRIGYWHCDRKKSEFVVTFHDLPFQLEYSGKFKRGVDGKWIAIITGKKQTPIRLDSPP